MVIMSAIAKEERDDVGMKLVSMKLAIEETCSTASPSKRLVKKRMEELRVIWEKLQTKHLHYCKEAVLGIESAESIEFLKRFVKLYNETEEVLDWFSRQQYVQDSYAVETSSRGTRSKREEEIDDIKKELSKPLLQDD